MATTDRRSHTTPQVAMATTDRRSHTTPQVAMLTTDRRSCGALSSTIAVCSEKLFKMVLTVLKQYTNKSVLWRKNLFISSLLKGFSKSLLKHHGKAQVVISVKLS